jgi:hypothetical protein
MLSGGPITRGAIPSLTEKGLSSAKMKRTGKPKLKGKNRKKVAPKWP